MTKELDKKQISQHACLPVSFLLVTEHSNHVCH